MKQKDSNLIIISAQNKGDREEAVIGSKTTTLGKEQDVTQ